MRRFSFRNTSRCPSLIHVFDSQDLPVVATCASTLPPPSSALLLFGCLCYAKGATSTESIHLQLQAGHSPQQLS